MNALSAGRQGPRLQERLLRGAHENFAEMLSSSLSAFLQSEISARLETVAFLSEGEFRQSLQAPSAVIRFLLEPRAEHAILYLDCPTVFSLLELLLGGSLGSELDQNRALTEIEWTLLEEVVRVMVGSLGQAWKAFHAVEFKVLALESDPELLPVSPALPTVQLGFSLRLGEQDASFQVAVPQTFFETAPQPSDVIEDGLTAEETQRNLNLLAEAKVQLEVLLEGPTMELRDIAELKIGQVVRFDYALQKPLRAMVNDTVSIPCQVVSAGRKRAFQIEQLP